MVVSYRVIKAKNVRVQTQMHPCQRACLYARVARKTRACTFRTLGAGFLGAGFDFAALDAKTCFLTSAFRLAASLDWMDWSSVCSF